MYLTNQNTRISPNVWTNVYKDFSLSDNISIQNVGCSDIFYSVVGSQPPKDHEAYRIFKRGEIITINSGGVGAWVFSQTIEGSINIEKVDSHSLERFDLYGGKIESILNELSIIRMHHEIITDNIIKVEDIEP